ncbi:hypothetical protein CUMW_156770 [Citrus unshiu]|uniref:AB hydrolase-1 domain-containing protein n=1 Tax=Citrus unshiu TaxID=55188 RepID=A0A2H5PQ07_CITUN|nr:hypothetical protein CUMW_156770 [Citrus unshiu]
MEEIKHSTVNVNGIKIHIAEKGEGPVVLFLHGFPEFWYAWRHQILALSCLGYRAVAPDLRGYGDTEVPSSSFTSYTCFHVAGDIIALIDFLGVEQEPGVLEAGIAHIGSKLMLSSSLTTRRPGPPIISEDAIAHLARGMINLPSWLSEEEFNYYVTKFDQTGFTGGLNYYRAIDF